MGLYKKHVPERGLVWEEAVLEALCYGWIDSQAQRIDEAAVRQRWTPRKPGSTWSAINVEAVERLSAEGRMRPAGLAAYERRRQERTGTYSYEQEVRGPHGRARGGAPGRPRRGGVLGTGHAVLPQGRDALGRLGQAAGHP